MNHVVTNAKEEELKKRMQQLGIRQEDIEERFIRSSGPGGQNVNKTSTCVYLKHKPTGVEVKCQDERSQALNRFLALRRLTNKIETLLLGKESQERKRIEKIKRQKRKRSKRSQEKILRLKHEHSQKKAMRVFRPEPGDFLGVAILTVGIVLSCCALGWCDTVVLKSGKRIEGKIVDRNDVYVTIERNGTPIYCERKYIKSIDETETAEATASPYSDHFKKGLASASSRKFQEAEKEFLQAKNKASDDRNNNAALELLASLKKGTVKEEYALSLFKGVYSLVVEDYPQAEQYLVQARQTQPSYPETYYYLHLYYYIIGHWHDCLASLEKYISLKPYDAVAYYNLGVIYKTMGNREEAVKNFTKAVEINPNDGESYGILGYIYSEMGVIGQALHNLRLARVLLNRQGENQKVADIDRLIARLQ